MTTENGKTKLIKHLKKWWLLYLGICLSTFVIYIGGHTEDGFIFPAEEYISAAAFVMLIATSLLQNIDLNLQREDLKLNRKALEEQREEMEKHTEEFQESNKSNQESLELQKFFELLRLKEELYVDILKEKEGNGVNVLVSFNDLKFNEFRYKALEKVHKEFNKYFDEEIGSTQSYYRRFENENVQNVYNRLTEEEKNIFNNIVDISVSETNSLEGYGLGSENSLVKLYTYHILLTDMVSDGTTGILNLFKAVEQASSNVAKNINKMLHGSTNEPITMKRIYNGILTKDEKELYMILGKNLNSDILFELEDAE